jgi:hypothetical protein
VRGVFPGNWIRQRQYNGLIGYLSFGIG